MSFQVRFVKYDVSSSVEEMKKVKPKVTEWRADSYSWENTKHGTILLTIENSNDGPMGVVEVDNTPGNMIAITKVVKEGLWLYGENCTLTIETFTGSENYIEDHIKIVNKFYNYFLAVECKSTKPTEVLDALNKYVAEQETKEEATNPIQLDIHILIQDKEFDTESYILKSVSDMWTRIDNDMKFGVLSAKPAKPFTPSQGRDNGIICIGPIAFGQLSDDLSIVIANKLKPFMKAFRAIDLKHEIAKVIVYEVYATRQTYEDNEMSCIRLELYVEDVESKVGKIEKVEIYL